jgi:uncharacterized damage-inducible protein DinB/quercetin dioxygenase-like cupin family protein
MKLRNLAFVLLLATQSGAQAPPALPHPELPDAVTADGNHYKVEFENEFVRALRIHYGPNETGNMHNHPHSVTVFLTDGKLKMTFPDGKSMVGTVSAGAVVFEEAGPHQPENLLDKPFEAVRIELKSPAESHQPAIQDALAADAARMAGKFTALAGAMAGKYEWRPGAGVRSVGDVFNLIVMENGMLTNVLTGNATQPAGKPEPIADPVKMQQALAASYKDLQSAIKNLSAADLAASVKFFGMDMTKQGAIMLLLGDQHEHLGQSIAYARTNGVVPPWSK